VIVDAPAITAVVSASGAVGTQVEIEGTDLTSAAAASFVGPTGVAVFATFSVVRRR